MIFNPRPQLVTMEGEYDNEMSFLGGNPYDVAELLGIEPDDAVILTSGEVLPRHISYLNAKYPEYMGIWPIIAAAGKALIGAIPKGIKAIKKAVNKKKKKKADKATAAKKAEEERKAAIAAAAAERQLIAIQKAEDQKKMMITIGVPALAVVAMLIMQRKKRR